MTKYYDDMGKDVTEYVQGLERKIMELQQKPVEAKAIPQIKEETAEKPAEPTPADAAWRSDKAQILNVEKSGTMDTEKPKPKRSKTYAEP